MGVNLVAMSLHAVKTFMLHNTSRDGLVEEISLARLPIVIGRGAEAEVCLDDRWVSRRHCQIDEVDGQLVVRDLGSKHGTLLNDRPIRESVLMPGDRLTVGLSEFLAATHDHLESEFEGRDRGCGFDRRRKPR